MTCTMNRQVRLLPVNIMHNEVYHRHLYGTGELEMAAVVT